MPRTLEIERPITANPEGIQPVVPENTVDLEPTAELIGQMEGLRKIIALGDRGWPFSYSNII